MHDDPKRAHGTIAARSGAPEAVQAEIEALRTVPLDVARHRVGEFTCSKSSRVQDFIRKDCNIFLKLRASRVFVLTPDDDEGRILGFYSLSATVVERERTNNAMQRKTPGGVPVPLALIGFMGKTDGAQKDMGAALIFDATLRVKRLQEHIGIVGLALHPENQELADKVYAPLGFQMASPLPADREGLRLPMFAHLSKFIPG